MSVLDLLLPRIATLPRVRERPRRPIPSQETDTRIEDLPFAVHLDRPVPMKHAIWLPLAVLGAALIAAII